MLTSHNTTRQLEESGIDTALIPFGSTEQFGPYLPMHIDCLQAEMYANFYGAALSAYVLPVTPFNTSEEHAHFKGTITLSPQLLSMMTEEIIAGLMRQGFRKFVLVSGHGGANWMGACIKHLNYKYPNVLIVHAHQNVEQAWNYAGEVAGFAHRNDIHGGLLGLCTALYHCPELIDYDALQSFGKSIPVEMNQFMDYMSWEHLTSDGSWGRFEQDSTTTKEELAERGRLFWETFVQKQSEVLKYHLAEAYHLKFDPVDM
jgi:creatinine amidohydrolase